MFPHAFVKLKFFLLFGLFSRNYVELGKLMPYILSSTVKSCWGYTIILISSYFALIYLQKDKMRYRIWVHIMLNNLASSPLQQDYYIWHRRSKCYEKTVKSYLERSGFKVFVQANNCAVKCLAWLLCFFSSIAT